MLVIVHGFPPAAQGGSEIYAELQARTLAEQHGDDVLVITREHVPDQPEYRLRTETRGALSIVWLNNTFSRTRSFSETYRNEAVASLAAGVIDDFGPDVAHVHHLTCLSTGIIDTLAQRQIPCFFTLHDFWLLCHRGQLLNRQMEVCPGPEPSGCDLCLDEAAGVGMLGYAAAGVIRATERRLPSGANRVLRRASRRLAQATTRPADATGEAIRRLEHMRKMASRVTHFLAPSDHFRRRFIEFGVAPERITHAPYGFDPRPYRGLHRTSSDRLRFGFLGSLMASKAPHLLLEAYGRLPAGSASVDLFGEHVGYHGDDSYRGRLEPLLAQDGVRVRGPIPHDGVPSALADIDVLVVPSIWPENSPLVIQEAFLAAIPVVASRIGGIPEVVTHQESGLLFNPNDPADLHRSLNRLLTEPELLPSLRRGLPAARLIDTDVAFTRSLYTDHLTKQIGRRITTPDEGTSGNAPPRVAAVVLNFESPDQTVLTVRSLLTSTRTLDPLIVVDNDPAHRCHDSLKPLMDRITYLPSERNLGFSGGMNLGIREGMERGATRVLLVNNDVIVPPDCVGKLEDALETAPHVGVVGPVILSRSNPDRIASLGMSYTSTTGRMRHRGHGFDASAIAIPPDAEVDGVSGCVMLVDGNVFEEVGLLDEEYFFGFEDLDFCLRARRAGYRSVLAGSTAVFHEGSHAIGPDSTNRLYYAARNHLRAAQHADPSTGRMHAFGRGLTIVALNLAHAVRTRGGSLAARLSAVACGTRDYLRGRFGRRRAEVSDLSGEDG